jgi:hypothetical protein
MAAAKPAPVSVTLPQAPVGYNVANEQQTRRAIEQAFQQCQRTSSRPIVTGAKGGNAAVTSLLAALVSLDLIVDQTT